MSIKTQRSREPRGQSERGRRHREKGRDICQVVYFSYWKMKPNQDPTGMILCPLGVMGAMLKKWKGAWAVKQSGIDIVSKARAEWPSQLAQPSGHHRRTESPCMSRLSLHGAQGRPVVREGCLPLHICYTLSLSSSGHGQGASHSPIAQRTMEWPFIVV